MRWLLTCTLILTATPVAAAQSGNGDEVPKIAIIHSTSFDPENAAIIDLLDSKDGKKVYLDTVSADLAIDDNYEIVRECFPAGNEENETALDGELNGKRIPIPTPNSDG